MLYLYTLGFMIFLFSSLAWAQDHVWEFDVNDPDQVDVENYGSELHTDRLSYRLAEHLYDLWRERRTGYQISAGSLNIKKFYFQQDIKFRSDPSQTIDLEYRQYRQEFIIEQNRHESLRISSRVFGNIHLGIMGFSTSEKKWGDLGPAAEYRLSEFKYLRLYYLSVDHYFNEKRANEDDVYERLPWQSGVEAVWEAENWRALLRYGYLGNLRWQRVSRGYEYSQLRRQYIHELEYSLTPAKKIFWYSSIDLKEEDKQWLPLTVGDSNFRKRMDRRSSRQRFGYQVQHGHPRDYSAGGVAVWTRETIYGYENTEEPQEEIAPSQKRADLMPYGAHQWRLSSNPAASWRLGLLFAHVERNFENEVKVNSETKGDLTFEYEVSQDSFVRTQATFDIDDIITLFPYNDGFTGWDGGNFQIVIVF